MVLSRGRKRSVPRFMGAILERMHETYVILCITMQHIPEEERGDMVNAYYKRLTSSDKSVQMAAARLWSVWEGSTSYLYQQPEV